MFEATLIAAKADARWAWEQIYREHSPMVLGYLRGQSWRDAEDLLSATFLDVVRSIDTFSGNRSAFRSWLLRIAHNRLVDLKRRQSRKPEQTVDHLPELVDANSDSEKQVSESESDDHFSSLVSQLPSDQGGVVFMRYALDLSLEQIANVMQKSVPAIKMLQQRALKNAAKLMSENPDSYPNWRESVQVSESQGNNL